MAQARATSPTAFSVRYIELLLEKAKALSNDEPEEVSAFYRNKPQSYFDEVEENGGKMKPQLKDNGGDQKSAINGRLEGVFFCVTLYKDVLPTKSPYGDKRICIPIAALFKDTTNLYFADFYCFGKYNHYIILVLTKQGTDADDFCKEYLPKLNPRKNKFLRRRGDKFYTAKQRHLWVEVFYTETVDIESLKSSGYQIDYVTGFGNRRSTEGGIPKYRGCSKCNLSKRARKKLDKKSL